MAPSSTIHIVRHGQGYHQLEDGTTDSNVHDPALRAEGVRLSKEFSSSFPYHDRIQLLCSSPLRRTIQTTVHAFEPEVKGRGMSILVLPDAQEATADLSDTGSDASVLRAEFDQAISIDYSELEEKPRWYEKVGDNAVDMQTLHARAARLRNWFRRRDEQEIVLVTHGIFAHYLTGHIDAQGNQTGEYWTNLMWRTFQFDGSSDEDDEAELIETPESKQRHRKTSA